MRKVLFDIRTSDPGCPRFIFDEKQNKVLLQDLEGKVASMSVSDFNAFIAAVKCGQLKEI
jgi:hypothetical protein